MGYRLKKCGRAERAANTFAAALLMPVLDLRRLWEEYGCNAGFREDILSDIFVVSAQALAARVKELRIANDRRGRTINPTKI